MKRESAEKAHHVIVHAVPRELKPSPCDDTRKPPQAQCAKCSSGTSSSLAGRSCRRNGVTPWVSWSLRLTLRMSLWNFATAKGSAHPPTSCSPRHNPEAPGNAGNAASRHIGRLSQSQVGQAAKANGIVKVARGLTAAPMESMPPAELPVRPGLNTFPPRRRPSKDAQVQPRRILTLISGQRLQHQQPSTAVRDSLRTHLILLHRRQPRRILTLISGQRLQDQQHTGAIRNSLRTLLVLLHRSQPRRILTLISGQRLQHQQPSAAVRDSLRKLLVLLHRCLTRHPRRVIGQRLQQRSVCSYRRRSVTFWFW